MGLPGLFPVGRSVKGPIRLGKEKKKKKKRKEKKKKRKRMKKREIEGMKRKALDPFIDCGVGPCFLRK